MERIVANYVGTKPGSMLLVFGSMHGNEPAGLNAIQLVMKMLEVEPIRNEGFEYKGTFFGMVGNKAAVESGERFLDRDLNRSWTSDNLARVLQANVDDLKNEDRELREIHDEVHFLLEKHKPNKLVVLDLHTTSSFGGIFSIATDDPNSLQIAKELHAPVITGMLAGIKGTVLHYFTTANLGVDTTTIAFESGQHNEKKSTNRAVAAIINCMRTIGAVDPETVENQHDQILIEYSKTLPEVAELITKYEIKNQGAFEMFPDYTNFQRVKKGERLALDDDQLVTCPADGLILMPLYQKRGDDGFFLVKEVTF